VLGTAVRLGVAFSVTARQDKKIRAAIDAIPEQAWTPIPYWLSTHEVSGADVAATTYTAFCGRDAIPVRLVVRRVRPTPGSQLALFTTWDYHAFVTNRPGDVLEVEADHRRHAGTEQLADGAVMVVGAGSSGVQIADELRQSGRQVYLPVGAHDRPPRS
jgi:hypothetical protein